MQTIKKSLGGSWTLYNEQQGIQISCEVPGSVFEALLTEKKIEDPFYGLNEHSVSWVYECDWVYKKVFELDDTENASSCVELTFFGLDTFCTVFFNGQELGKAENMHRTYPFTLKNSSVNLLKPGENVIEVHFESPTQRAGKMINALPIDYYKKRADPTAIPGVELLRKAYYSFGWDWGPKLPDIGIWRNVELTLYQEGKIDDIMVSTSLIGDGHFDLKGLTTWKEAEVVCHLKVDFSVEMNSENAFYRIEWYTPSGEKKEFDERWKGEETVFRFIEPNPQLWWTAEWGIPNLYTLRITLWYQDHAIDQIERKIGIRKIELVRDKDAWGETFYFRLNELPVFAKGANWIPVDSFIPRGKKAGFYASLLKNALKANMNMLRVWGGGIYEDDEFYNLCDTMGILVWQDFAFACKPTPDYEGFIDNVAIEAKQNILRLRNHPCLAIWVGNNEIEEGWLYWGFEDVVPHLKKQYTEIFEKLLPSLVRVLDAGRSYWPSSPSSGGNFEDTRSPDKGDSHYWMVWHAMYPFHAYRKFNSRFMSEFGFESFPGMKTIQAFCPPEQRMMHSPIMENHQKNPAGNKKILDYMEARFRIPEEFEKQVIISQITHAEAMEYGVEHWRRNRNDFHCMGSLYWQFNDCWPVASWSSVDYYGRWKALQYAAKRFYSPLFLSIEEEGTEIALWVTNDLPIKHALQVECEIYDYNGNILQKVEQMVRAKAFSSMKVHLFDISNFLLEIPIEQLICFYRLKHIDGSVIMQGSKLMKDPKDFPLFDPKLTWKVRAIANESFIIEISTEENALYVFLDNENYDFINSDNFFSMKKGEKRMITVTNSYPIDEIEFVRTLRIKSLFDLCNG